MVRVGAIDAVGIGAGEDISAAGEGRVWNQLEHPLPWVKELMRLVESRVVGLKMVQKDRLLGLESSLPYALQEEVPIVNIIVGHAQ